MRDRPSSLMNCEGEGVDHRGGHYGVVLAVRQAESFIVIRENLKAETKRESLLEAKDPRTPSPVLCSQYCRVSFFAVSCVR